MRTTKRIIAMLLAAILIVFSMTDVASASTIEISDTEVMLAKGMKYVLCLTKWDDNYEFGEDISNTEIKWKSSDKKVASVSKKGVVKAKKVGEATVIAKYGNKKYKCKITVQNMKKYEVGYGTKEISLTGKLSYVESTHIGNGQKVTGYILTLSKPVLFVDVEYGFDKVVDEIQVNIDEEMYEKYKDKKVTLFGNVGAALTAWYLRAFYMNNVTDINA